MTYKGIDPASVSIKHIKRHLREMAHDLTAAMEILEGAQTTHVHRELNQDIIVVQRSLKTIFEKIIRLP